MVPAVRKLRRFMVSLVGGCRANLRGSSGTVKRAGDKYFAGCHSARGRKSSDSSRSRTRDCEGSGEAGKRGSRAAGQCLRARTSTLSHGPNAMSNLSVVDIIVIGGYFLLLAAIAWWAAKREKNVSADFFLASRDVGWLAVGASLFASNIGREHLVGLAGTGAAGGLAVGHFEWLASFILLLLGWLFVPFYLRSGVYTMPEFLERRYNPG